MTVKNQSIPPISGGTPQPPLVEDEVGGAFVGLAQDAEAIYVAPNWKLVWWRFKRHRLALFSGIVIMFIVAIALVPAFFSTQIPHETSATRAFIPLQGIHFYDEDGFNLFVYAMEGQRNQTTLMMEWVPDETKKIPLRLFAKGYEYEIFGK